MKKMNNKGQTLVLFIIMLPIILLVLLITIEIGNIYIEKTKTINVIKETIKTSLKNDLSNDAINALIELNVKDIKTKQIYTSDEEIEIKLIQEKKVFGKKIEIQYKYNGLKQEEKINIKEG